MNNSPTPHRRPRAFRPGGGFWVVAAAFMITMAFGTLPAPLWALYQREDNFPTWLITVVFATYAVGVVASLLFVSGVSDTVGRRPVILSALTLELLAAVIFIESHQAWALIVARFISGVGVGALTATATAHLGELHTVAFPTRDPARASTVATVVNTGGLAVGPLAGGLFAQYSAAPLVAPFVASGVALATALIAFTAVPETVQRNPTRSPYRPQRVRVPAEIRAPFLAAGAGAFAGFAVIGLFSALTPTVLGAFRAASPLTAGLIVFGAFSAATVAQLLSGRMQRRTQVSAATILMILGLMGIAISVLIGSLPVFVIAGVLAGAGAGLLFRSAVASAAALASPQQRGATLSAVFLLSYLGLSAPVVLVGIALSFLPLAPVLLAFSIAVAAATAWAGLRMRR